MSKKQMTLAEILAEKEEAEMEWDYRLFNKREKKRFLQKRNIIQENYENNIKRLTSKVLSDSLWFCLDYREGSLNNLEFNELCIITVFIQYRKNRAHLINCPLRIQGNQIQKILFHSFA